MRLRSVSLFLLACILSAGSVFAQTPTPPSAPGYVDNLDEFIEDPTVFAQNQEPTHAPRTIPYPSVESARRANEFGTELEDRWSQSPYFQLLNGTWAFTYFERPALVPDNYDEVDWETIRVPKSWQTAGYDQLVYVNTPLTWEGIDEATDTRPPEVPDDYNPVGVYRRSFTADADWVDRQNFLHFEGTKQAYFVWINGTYVGYDQGSATPSEFNVTDLLQYGEENQITVQVYRFSDGEALETQDAMRFSGIHRSVYLFSKPSTYVQDLAVRATLDDAFETGTVTIDATVMNEGGAGPHEVAAHLFGPDGERLRTFSTTTAGTEDSTTVTLETTVEDPELWSAESPTLYDLGVTISPTDGAPLEAMVESVGFRHYSVSDGLFRVNGEPVNIRGMNRPEHDHKNGRHVPFKTLLHDVKLMKRHNIDALRTAHYPNDPSVYALADEYGIYVQDEVNVETHWNVQLVNEQPEYHPQMLERFRRMMQRDRNRPSIFTWSTGNEAGYGPAHEQMAEYAQSLPGSYLLYHQDNENSTAPYSPIHGDRYPTVQQLLAIPSQTEKPLIMGEYRHAFGNATGSLHTFWDYIQPPVPNPPDSLRALQGGFLWDWADQTVERPDQSPFLRHGVTDGVVDGDRTIYPEMAAVKEAHQPMAVHPVDLTTGRVEIGNQYNFTDFSARDVRWRLSADGETLQSGTLDLALPPGEWTETTIPFNRPDLQPGTEYWLTVTLHHAKDTPYADDGYTVATEKHRVPFDVPATERVAAQDLPSLDVSESDGTITVSGPDFEYTFDENSGTLSSLEYQGTSLVSNGPRLNLWRAPVLPEEEGYWGRPAEKWRAAGLNALSHNTESVDVTETDGAVRISISSTVHGGGEARATVDYDYTVLGRGDILVDVNMRPTDSLRAAVSTLPRVGLKVGVPTDLAHVQWYGRGPGGTFPDRPGGMRPGVYEGTVAEQFEPVRPPQTNGVKMDTRWAALSNGESGLVAVSDPSFAFGVNPFSNLSSASTPDSLQLAETLTVTLDHDHMGVGTKFHSPVESVLLPPEPTQFRFRLRPYNPSEDTPSSLAKERFELPNAFN